MAGIASNAGDASSLSIEGSIFFAADIAHSLAVFSLALPVELFYAAGLISYSSRELTVDGGVHVYRTAQLISERIVPTLTETLKAFAAELPAGGSSATTTSGKSQKKNNNNNSGDYLSDMQELQRTLHTAQLAAMRLFHRLLEVSATPLPSDAPVSSTFSSSSAAAAATSEALPSQGQSWFELFSAADSGPTGPPSTSTSMLLDYLTHLPNGLSFVEPLLVPTFGDVGTVHGYLRSLAQEAGVSLPLPVVKEAPTTTTTAATAAAAASMDNDPTDGRPPVSAALQSKIDMLKDMFPDCGMAFLEACLRFYNEQEHEVLDALLNDNLHPRLAALDRSMATFPKKTSTTTSTNVSHKKPTANETVDIFAHRQDPTFVAQQIAYVRQREALQAADAALLRREYDDDYDDQFDDLISKKDTAAENEYAESIYEAPAKNGSGNGRKREEWHRQMAETRRYNTLLREEENEIAFWKNLAVQNHRAPSATATATAGDGGGEGTAVAAKPMKTAAAAPAGGAATGKEPSSNKAGTGGKRPAHTAGEGGGGGGKHAAASTGHKNNNNNNTSGKGDLRSTATAEEDSSSATVDPQQQQQQGGKGFRTKTFDRHHQKDKALRKLGAFRPT